jgi:hypothetical protein
MVVITLPSVTVVDLSFNEISEWPNILFSPTQLEKEEEEQHDTVEKQEQTQLHVPGWLAFTRRLCVLRLAHNRLTHVPVEWFPCAPTPLWPNLAILALDHNKLTELPFGVGLMPHLTVLRVDGNPLRGEWREAYLRGVDVWTTFRQNARADTDTVARESDASAVSSATTSYRYTLPHKRRWPRGMFGSNHVLQYARSLFEAVPIRHVPMVLIGERNSGKSTLLATLDGLARMHVQHLVEYRVEQQQRLMQEEKEEQELLHQQQHLQQQHESTRSATAGSEDEDMPDPERAQDKGETKSVGKSSKQAGVISSLLSVFYSAVSAPPPGPPSPPPAVPTPPSSDRSSGGSGTDQRNASSKVPTTVSSMSPSGATSASATTSPTLASTSIPKASTAFGSTLSPSSSPWWEWWQPSTVSHSFSASSSAASLSSSSTQPTAAVTSTHFLLPLNTNPVPHNPWDDAPSTTSVHSTTTISAAIAAAAATGLEPVLATSERMMIPPLSAIEGLMDLVVPVQAHTSVSPQESAATFLSRSGASSGTTSMPEEAFTVSASIPPDAGLAATAFSQLVHVPTLAITAYDIPGHHEFAASNALFLSTSRAVLLVCLNLASIAALASLEKAATLPPSSTAPSPAPTTANTTASATASMASTPSSLFVATPPALSLEHQLFKYLAAIQARASTSPASCVTFLVLTHADALNPTDVTKTVTFAQKQLLPRLKSRYPAAQVQECWHCNATDPVSVENQVQSHLTKFFRNTLMAQLDKQAATAAAAATAATSSSSATSTMAATGTAGAPSTKTTPSKSRPAALKPVVLDIESTVPRFVFRIRRALHINSDALLRGSSHSTHAPQVHVDEPVLTESSPADDEDEINEMATSSSTSTSSVSAARSKKSATTMKGNASQTSSSMTKLNIEDFPLMANVPCRWFFKHDFHTLVQTRWGLTSELAQITSIMLRALGDLLLVDEQQLVILKWEWLAAVAGLVNCPFPILYNHDVRRDGPSTDAASTSSSTSTSTSSSSQPSTSFVWPPITSNVQGLVTRNTLVSALVSPSPFARDNLMPRWTKAPLMASSGACVFFVQYLCVALRTCTSAIWTRLLLAHEQQDQSCIICFCLCLLFFFLFITFFFCSFSLSFSPTHSS